MKKFMTSFAAIAAGFAAQHATAAPAPQDATKVASDAQSLAQGETASNGITVKNKSGDTFAFTLKRVGANGQLMAWHESHSSHTSHASHHSHYSSS